VPLAFLDVASAAGPIPAPTPSASLAGPALGIALDEVEYPWPVHFLSLALDGQESEAVDAPLCCHPEERSDEGSA
jgi:hypothetical protein